MILNQTILGWSFGISFLILGVLYQSDTYSLYKSLIFCVNVAVLFMNISNLLEIFTESAGDMAYFINICVNILMIIAIIVVLIGPYLMHQFGEIQNFDPNGYEVKFTLINFGLMIILSIL